MNFADQRVLKSTPATLAAQFVDQDGVNVTATAPVTVGIVRSDGSVLQAPGGATVAAGSTYTFALTAVQTATLDRLTCTWTATSGQVVVTHVDVVGGFAFTLAEMIALDGMGGLSTQRQRDLRQAVEELVEIRTGWLWTRRLVVETFTSATWESRWPLRLTYPPFKTLRSVKIDGTAQTLTNWPFGLYGGSDVAYPSWSGAGVQSTLEVIYEAGEDRPPVSLVLSLLDAARQTQLDRAKGSSSRVLSQTNEFGNINYARATAENLFGNPAVDAVLAAWDRRVPGIA